MTPPPDPSPPHDRGLNRRGFFRSLLLRGMEQAEEAGRQVHRRVASSMEAGAAAAARSSAPVAHAPLVGAGSAGRYLRPPGALPEPQFASTCSRCGKCVQVCPAQCIVLDPLAPAPAPAPGSAPDAGTAHVPAPRAGGLPFIEARRSPCVVCDDLSCMKACPTGALKLVESIARIHMGLAMVDHSRCLRGADGHGEPCTLCIVPCPIGESAIGLDSLGRIQIRPACIGCGLCERACPTEPASVWVVADEVASG